MSERRNPAIRSAQRPAVPNQASELSEARLSLRLDPAHKALIDRAAAYSGETVTSFATATLVRRARKIIRDHQVTRLSEEGAVRLLELLDNPPAPNEALKRAARRYAELVEDRTLRRAEGENG